MKTAFLAICASIMLTNANAGEIPLGYKVIAEEKGVPALVLYAVAYGESQAPTSLGRTMPWPWSANVNGKAYRFNSRNELYEFAKSHISRGKTLIDLCASQVNWHWNKDRFKDLYQATDPVVCLNVSADILKSLYEKTNDWHRAIGFYHHPKGGSRAQKYADNIFSIMKKIDANDKSSTQGRERIAYLDIQHGTIKRATTKKVRSFQQKQQNIVGVNKRQRKIIVIE